MLQVPTTFYEAEEFHVLIRTLIFRSLIYFFSFSYFFPDKGRKGKRKTIVQKKTVQPVWNDKFDFKNISVSDLQICVLEVTVWDHNSSGHQFLGGLRLGFPQEDEYWHDCFDKEVLIWTAMIKHLGMFAEFTIPLRATMTTRKVGW